MHENIGRGQISVSTLPATATATSSGGSSKDHLIDDTSIEYTSFGGPAQNNDAVMSRAEQMSAHRRVRINPLFFLRKIRFSETQLLGPATLFAGAVSVLFFFFFFFAVAPDCGFFTASWWFANRFFGRHGRRGSSKGMFMFMFYVEASCLLPKPQNYN